MAKKKAPAVPTKATEPAAFVENTSASPWETGEVDTVTENAAETEAKAKAKEEADAEAKAAKEASDAAKAARQKQADEEAEAARKAAKALEKTEIPEGAFGLKFKKLNVEAQLPAFATDGAACFDIKALSYEIGDGQENSAIYKTGLAVEVPEGYVMQIFSRSGHGFRAGVRLSNCVGIIDSDYRGELKVKLVRDNTVAAIPTFKKGERIAQGMLVKLADYVIVEVAELSNTERGENGLGSTGS